MHDSVAETIDVSSDPDVEQALRLLIRTQPTTDELFTCPATNADKWDFGDGANAALNWVNRNSSSGVLKNLSYQYQHPFPDSSTGGQR